jgi:hypothetical protein
MLSPGGNSVALSERDELCADCFLPSAHSSGITSGLFASRRTFIWPGYSLEHGESASGWPGDQHRWFGRNPKAPDEADCPPTDEDCRRRGFVPFLRMRRSLWSCLAWLSPLLAAALLVGCASRGPDWKSLIGIVTYDEAVLELGPPNHVATLQDGTKVAEWLEITSRVYSMPGAGFGYWGPWGGAGWNAGTVNTTPSVFLLLTFGPDQKLASVRRIYK